MGIIIDININIKLTYRLRRNLIRVEQNWNKILKQKKNSHKTIFWKFGETKTYEEK